MATITRVPPGGFVGAGQQTLATQHLLRQWMGNGRMNGTRKRRRKSAAKSAAPKRRRRLSAKGGKARLVKGSKAAKAYMAKIRRMRKK